MVSDFFSISRIYFVVFVQEIWINFLLGKRILGIGREIRIWLARQNESRWVDMFLERSNWREYGVEVEGDSTGTVNVESKLMLRICSNFRGELVIGMLLESTVFIECSIFLNYYWRSVGSRESMGVCYFYFVSFS